jgi:hypothetical protein
MNDEPNIFWNWCVVWCEHGVASRIIIDNWMWLFRIYIWILHSMNQWVTNVTYLLMPACDIICL